MVQITARHHELMESQGFCILDNVFTIEEMNDLSVLIETYQKRHEAALAEKGGSEGISRANEITFTAYLAENDPEIMKFCKRPEFVQITTTFLGKDVDLYWNQSVFKMPEGKKEFPWHQDDGYTPVDPSPYLTLWLALNDATPENGCISALPASYKRGLIPHVQTPLGLACHELDDPDQGVRVPVKAGSIAAFWSLTCHKSGANLSTEIRKAYIVQYSHSDLKNATTGERIANLTPITRDGAGVGD